ncbi:hypothetical protein GCM10009560_03050 [Nonomuraea longicatena]|uniref:Uncharacterized protein n=2 Tax=Nonomuraea longicatena TaxID=83682 RepID=A0ABP3Z143_9ACTN
MVPMPELPDRIATLAFAHGADRFMIVGRHSLRSLMEAEIGQRRKPTLHLNADRVDVDYPHTGILRRPEPAAFHLSTRVGWRLELVGGVHDLRADLSELDVHTVTVDGGMTESAIELGDPKGARTFTADHLSHVEIRRPPDVPVRVVVTRSAAHLRVDGRHLGHTAEVELQSQAYDLHFPGYTFTFRRADRVTIATT